MLSAMLVALILSLFSSLLLIRYLHVHQHVTADMTEGPQKFHLGITPRVGGIAFFSGLLGGAIVATIALLLPGTLFVFGLGFAYGMNSDHPLANVILGGVAAGTAALMLYVTWKVGKKTFKQRKSLTIIVLTFVLMSMVKLPLVLVILVVLTLGLYVNRPSSVSTPKEVS